jgi:hypothetical protein
MANRLVMARLVRKEEAGRDFDVEFWQALGDAKIFAAAWDLVVTAAAMRGISEDQLRLQRSVATLKRRPRPISRGGRVRGDEVHGTVQHEGSGHLD